MPPKRRDHTKQRELLAAASEKLKALNEEQLADAVAYALTDNYADAAIYHRREKGRKTANMPITTYDTLRAHLQQAAKEDGVTLSALANEALRDFLNGKFTPSRPRRAAYGSQLGASVNINVRPDSELRAKADERCKQLAEDLDWKPSTSQVIKQYLIAKYPMQQYPPLEQFPPGDSE
ncbi:hypothetical protein [Streptomyces nigrescens]